MKAFLLVFMRKHILFFYGAITFMFLSLLHQAGAHMLFWAANIIFAGIMAIYVELWEIWERKNDI